MNKKEKYYVSRKKHCFEKIWVRYKCSIYILDFTFIMDPTTSKTKNRGKNIVSKKKMGTSNNTKNNGSRNLLTLWIVGGETSKFPQVIFCYRKAKTQFVVFDQFLSHMGGLHNLSHLFVHQFAVQDLIVEE